MYGAKYVIMHITSNKKHCSYEDNTMMIYYTGFLETVCDKKMGGIIYIQVSVFMVVMFCKVARNTGLMNIEPRSCRKNRARFLRASGLH